MVCVFVRKTSEPLTSLVKQIAKKIGENDKLKSLVVILSRKESTADDLRKLASSAGIKHVPLTTHGDHAVVSAGYDGSIAVWDAWAANALLFRYQGFALDGGGPCRSITLTATPRALGGKSVEDAPASSRLAIAYVGHDATWRTLLLRAPHQLETTARHVAASSLADLAAAKRAVLMASIAARAGVRPPAAAASDDEDDDLVALKKRK